MTIYADTSFLVSGPWEQLNPDTFVTGDNDEAALAIPVDSER